MSKDLVVKKGNLPAHLQAKVSREEVSEYSAGVTSGFPVLSYRGKVWRVKVSGEEQVYLNEDDEAIQTLHAVLVRSNPALSKTYYEGQYKEGDSGKPKCWSSDGKRPDSEVPAPMNSQCAGCPKNEWGSRITDDGKKMKACQDVRRVAVVLAHELEAVAAGEKPIGEVPVMLLRIPPATLNPLKDYAERTLAPKGAVPHMLVTKIGFETDAAYPKLTFKGARWLSEDEFDAVTELRDSDAVKRVLDTSAEHVEEGNTEDDDEESSNTVPANDEVSESAPSEALSEEDYSEEVEDDDDDDDEIAPPPPRAAAVEEEAVEEDQPPKPSKKKAKSKKKSKTEKAPPPPSDDEDDFDDMLSSILD